MLSTAAFTHPETAWLLHAVLPTLIVVAVLIAGLLVRPHLTLLVAAAQERRARRGLTHLAAAEQPDPALIWVPETIPAARFVVVGLTIAVGLAAGLSLVAPLAFILPLGLPLTALALWGLNASAASRYNAALDQELTAAVGRLSAFLRAGSGLRPAIERVVNDMRTGPLQAEWSFLLTRQGLPLAGGGIATPRQVVTALADQTPSRRHAALLNHLGASVGQPQEVLARRCEAAYAALQRSDRRRDEAVTELAQMRYSGMAVGLAGVAMAVYLTWSQWSRVVFAYSTPLGAVVGVVVLAALALPIIGGMLLARVEDSDY